MEEAMKLKNGTEEHNAAVGTTLMLLRALHEEHPMAFAEAVHVAQEPDYVPIPPAIPILEENPGLYPMHDTVRNIIVSAVTGDFPTYCIGDPEDKSYSIKRITADANADIAKAEKDRS
jgi:hypothetical protein